MSRIAFVVELDIAEGRMDAYLEIARAHAQNSKRLEEGCLCFDVLCADEVKHKVFLIEHYRDEAAVEEHFSSAHMAAYRERTMELVQRRVLTRCTL